VFSPFSPPFPPAFFLYLYSQRMPPLQGNKSTVIAGVMAVHPFFRSGEEDEQCWWPFAFWSFPFWKFCNQDPG
jgi:hypothetical protein